MSSRLPYSGREMVTGLRNQADGIQQHSAQWPGSAPSRPQILAVVTALETLLNALDDLLAQTAAKRNEINAAMSDQAEDMYRAVRKVVYALFEGREADFGMKPRKTPTTHPVPARPEELRVTELSPIRVKLTYSRPEHTQFFKIYSSADMVFNEDDLVATSMTTEAEVDAPPNETRHYSVKAVNAAGESEFAPSVSRTTY